jgi:hypothetical protein
VDVRGVNVLTGYFSLMYEFLFSSKM